MNTPISDFVRNYAAGNPVRLHMPGHKGTGQTGCELLDITEIPGADSLYEADGIIAESERNASELFGSGRTFYSTEGSSHCIRAMLTLAVWYHASVYPGIRPVVLAARNAHKSFLYAAGLLDFDIVWLWPENRNSICACAVEPEQLEAALRALPCPPAALYITSPDYLGGTCDLPELILTAHRSNIPVLVDNAHGAYLRFLQPSRHPVDLGADLCCDSAHKTLPVLTGGAYLHTGPHAPKFFSENGKRALALSGSTSPSYLILQSLDLCNQRLAQDYPERISRMAELLENVRLQLRQNGWKISETDPLKLTIDCAASGQNGCELANRLQKAGIFCEYCDADDLVFMATPENTQVELQNLVQQLGQNTAAARARLPLPGCSAQTVVTVREGLWMPHAVIPAEQAAGYVCGAPVVSCPPAIPIAVTGERITEEMVRQFRQYGIEQAEILIL